jgi:hypothetical protein
VDEKEFLAKLKSAQVTFSLAEVIAFAPLAQKIFSKILSEEDVIKFHVNPIRSRSATHFYNFIISQNISEKGGAMVRLWVPQSQSHHRGGGQDYRVDGFRSGD